MKKIILIISAFIVIFISVLAQEPSANKTIRKDRVWKYDDIHLSIGEQGPVRDTVVRTVKYERDTIIDNVEYMQFSCDKILAGSDKMLLREDNGRIFSYIQDPDWGSNEGTDTCEFLLYDFNLSSDTKYTTATYVPEYGFFFHWLPAELTVTKSYEMKIGDITLTCQDIYCPKYAFPVRNPLRIIEEIGPLTFGTIGKLMFYGPISTGGETIWLEFRQLEDLEGNVICTREEIDEITGVETVVADRREADGRKYDLMGREIRNPQPGTLYIRDGRKHIAR